MRWSSIALAAILSWNLAPVASASTVAGSIPVGQSPYGIAVDEVAGRAYVANGGSGTVSVIDVGTERVVGTVWVGGSPAQVAVDQGTARIYVSNFDTAGVTVIDASSLTVVGSLRPGGLGLAIDATRGLLYSTAGTVLAVFDLSTGATVATVPSGGSWWGIAVDTASQRLYIEDLAAGDHGVVVLDARTYERIARVPIAGEARFGITFDPALQLVYVPNYASSGSISVIDARTNTVAHTVGVGAFPFALALDASRLYSADLGGGTVTVLETVPSLRVIETVSVGGAPAGVARLPGRSRIYVTDKANARVAIISVATPNTPPTIDSVTISPRDPLTTAVLSSTVAAHDPDGDAITFTYQWVRGGLDIPGATAPTLDLAMAGNGDRGDAIAVRVVASDGTSASRPVTSEAVIVANSAPTATVSLSSTVPTTRETVVATVVARDADADPVFLTYVWTVNGVVRQTTTTTATTDSFDLRLPRNGNVGDTINVVVTPSDGSLSGAAASASGVVRRGS